jgi:hypothetical protein
MELFFMSSELACGLSIQAAFFAGLNLSCHFLLVPSVDFAPAAPAPSAPTARSSA